MTFKPISETPDSDALNELPFKLKKNHIVDWLSKLPPINSRASGESILAALRSLRNSNITVEFRFEILDLFHPYVVRLGPLLEKQFMDIAFPLTEELDFLAGLQIQLYQQMAEDYTDVCQSQDFMQPPKPNKDRAAMVLQRGLFYWDRVLFQLSIAYKPLDSGFWSRVYGLYTLAEGLELLDHAIQLEINTDELDASATVQSYIKRILVFALAQPNRYRQRELVQIYWLTEQFGDQCVFSTGANQSGDRAADFFIDLSEAAAPRPMNACGAPERENLRFLSTRPIIENIIKQRNSLKKLYKQCGVSAKFSKHVVRVFLRGLFGTETRKFRRQSGVSEGRLFIGLANLIEALGLANLIEALSSPKDTVEDLSEHTQNASGHNPDLSGSERLTPDLLSVGDLELEGVEENTDRSTRSEYQLGNLLLDTDYGLDQCPEIWDKPKATAAQNARHIEYTARFLDSSATGHCFLWTEKNNPILRVGEVMGILAGQSALEVATIRWIKASDNEFLRFGVELISPRAEVAVISLPNCPETSTEVLFLPEIESFRQPMSVLMRSSSFKPGDWVSLTVDSQQKIYRLENLIETTAGYSRLALYRPDTDPI